MARWLKAPGDRVAKMEPLLEISTDKIDTEVPAPANGILLEIVVAEGSTVATGAALAYIGEPDATVGIERLEPPSQHTKIDDNNQSVAKPSTYARAPQPVDRPTGRAFVSPVVSRIAAEERIDLEQVTGTGLGGRVTKKDVLAFVAQRGKVRHDKRLTRLKSLRG